MEKKAGRNKTISLSDDLREYFLSRCVSVNENQLNISAVMNKTVIGDSVAVCGLLPEKSVDLIIADPPYNLRKDFGDSTFAKMSDEEYDTYTESWLLAVKPLLKDTGSIYVCCDWKSSLIIGRLLDRHFHVRNRITWQREKGRGARANWKNSMEDIWFATAGSDYTFNLDDVKLRRRVIAPYKENGTPKDWVEESGVKYRDTCPSNFWDDITVPFWSMSENTPHPTQKPEKLVAKLILASSNEGDVVLDPFLGSGTTSVVAKKLNRNYIGIEKEAEYCAIAEKRLQDADNDDKIQGYSDGIFYERNFGTKK